MLIEIHLIEIPEKYHIMFEVINLKNYHLVHWKIYLLSQLEKKFLQH